MVRTSYAEKKQSEEEAEAEEEKFRLKQYFFRKWAFAGEDDRGKTSSRALVFTHCDIQSERL